MSNKQNVHSSVEIHIKLLYIKNGWERCITWAGWECVTVSFFFIETSFRLKLLAYYAMLSSRYSNKSICQYERREAVLIFSIVINHVGVSMTFSSAHNAPSKIEFKNHTEPQFNQHFDRRQIHSPLWNYLHVIIVAFLSPITSLKSTVVPSLSSEEFTHCRCVMILSCAVKNQIETWPLLT